MIDLKYRKIMRLSREQLPDLALDKKIKWHEVAAAIKIMKTKITATKYFLFKI